MNGNRLQFSKKSLANAESTFPWTQDIYIMMAVIDHVTSALVQYRYVAFLVKEIPPCRCGRAMEFCSEK